MLIDIKPIAKVINNWREKEIIVQAAPNVTLPLGEGLYSLQQIRGFAQQYLDSIENSLPMENNGDDSYMAAVEDIRTVIDRLRRRLDQ